MLPDKIKPASRYAPSLLVQQYTPLVETTKARAVKLCRIVKPVPSVLMANTVPEPELPPICAVPYSVLPDKTKSWGYCPFLPANVAVKLCRTVKFCAVTRPARIKPRPAINADRRNNFFVFIG